MDLNHRPLPYQGSALTKLSYRPLLLIKLLVEVYDLFLAPGLQPSGAIGLTSSRFRIDLFLAPGP